MSIDENNFESKQVGVVVYIKETGDKDLTDYNGMFRIYVNQGFRSGDRLTIGIEKEGWEIKSPILGEVFLPNELSKELIKINILPKSSPAFYIKPKEFAEYYALKSQSNNSFYLSKQFKPDFKTILDTLEFIWGFKKSEIKIAVNEWIEQALKDTSASYEKALAEYSRKNLDLAGRLFNQSADLRIEKFKVLDEDFKKLSNERKKLINETIRDLRLAGDSFYENKNFDSSLISYKKSIEFLKYSKDWETLVSSLNRIASCYYYLSSRLADESFFEQIDSAVTYLRSGLELSQIDSLREWEWRFIGNLATLNVYREIYSDRNDKTSVLRVAIKNLELVEDNRINDSDSKDRFVIRNNIGIFYDYLYQFTDNVTDAKQYLDSAMSYYFSIINDSSLKLKNPFEISYLVYNYALTSIEINFNKYSIPSFYEDLALRVRDFNDGYPDNSINQIVDTAYINSLNGVYLIFVEVEKIFSKENKSLELPSVLNSMARLRIQQIAASYEFLNDRFITVTDSIIQVADKLAQRDSHFREIMYAIGNNACINIIKMLTSKETSIDKIISSNSLIEDILSQNQMLTLYKTYLKRIKMLNYYLLSKLITDKRQRNNYQREALSLNEEIIINYKKLGYSREYEEAVRIKNIINRTN